MQIIAECEVHCQGVLDLVDSDLLGVETEHFVDASLSTKSTIGLMVFYRSIRFDWIHA